MRRTQSTILATCCLPWNEDFSLDENLFRKEIRFLLKNATENLYIFGSAGEGYSVTDKEFLYISRIFTDEMSSNNARPMIGVMGSSSAQILDRLRAAYDLGVRSFQLSLPYWGRCTMKEILYFFDSICPDYEDCCFLHYNCEKTKRMLNADEYADIAARFPNITATKNIVDSVKDIFELVTKSPQIMHFFMEYGFGIASLLGLEAGLVVAPASTNWKKARKFYNACRSADVVHIRNMLPALIQIQETLIKTVGPEGHMDGTYDKIYARMAFPDFPLRLRQPYTAASEETYQSMIDFLEKELPEWHPQA